MENMTAEEIAEKMAQAMELSRKRGEQKKSKEPSGKGKSSAALKTKSKAPPRPRGSKRSAGEASVPEQDVQKRRGLVDQEELRNSPSGRVVVPGHFGTPDTIVEITARRDRDAGDETFLGWNPEYR